MQKTNKPLWILFAIFTLPLVISGLLFHYHAYFHFKTMNHGTLVQTPLNVKYLYSEVNPEEQKKWRVIYIASQSCDDACQNLEYALQQVKKALGKETDRVSILSLTDQNKQVALLKTALAQPANHKIYLVDPRDNLFMVYPDTVNPMDILKDLQRVLEVSQIG